MTKRAFIPVIPDDPLRVTVKVERKIYRLAQELRIDVHSLWRMHLQDAVDTLTPKEDPKAQSDLA